MKRYFSLNYLRRIGRWLWQGKFHILSLAAVIVTILYIVGVLDYWPNIVSAALSITGLLIILTQQMLDARQFADHKPNTVRQWLRSFPTVKPITASVSGVLSASGALKMRARTYPPVDASLEQKVDFLLRQIDGLHTAIANIDERVDRAESSLEQKSKEIKTQLDSIDKSLKETIVGHIVGTYDVNLFGIIITICGTLIQFFSSPGV